MVMNSKEGVSVLRDMRKGFRQDMMLLYLSIRNL
jgi:hypothetical protein